MAKKKKIPQTAEQVLEAIKQGDLDRRCAIARQIIKTRDVISKNVEDSVKAILVNAISIGCQIQDRIVKEMQGKDLITEDGRVDKLVSSDLVHIQKALISNCSLLAQLEGIFPYQKTQKRTEEKARTRRNRAIADVVLEVNNDVDFD